MSYNEKENISHWMGSLVKINNNGSFDLPNVFKNKETLYGILSDMDFISNKFSITLVDKVTGDTYSGNWIPCNLVERIASISEIIDMFTDKSYDYFN